MPSLRPLFSYISGGCAALFGTLSLLGKARFVVLTLLLLVALWGVAMLWTHKIDDNPDFALPILTEAKGQPSGNRISHAVNTAIALIEREVSEHPWVANDPFFMPGHYLDNMPNYQQGIIYALSRFTVLLGDQIGRARGSSQVDDDLDKAAGFLKYAGDIWMVNTKVSLMPVASSEAQYRAALGHLIKYNQRLSEGKAVFDPRSDNLQATMDSIAGDLGSQSAIIENYLREGRFWLVEGHADDIFYATKGRMYAYYLILRALGEDYKQLIHDRDLTNVWQNMLESFSEAVALRPWVIMSAAPDSQFLPSHLAAQGFYVLRARTNLREITSILSK